MDSIFADQISHPVAREGLHTPIASGAIFKFSPEILAHDIIILVFLLYIIIVAFSRNPGYFPQFWLRMSLYRMVLYVLEHLCLGTISSTAVLVSYSSEILEIYWSIGRIQLCWPMMGLA